MISLLISAILLVLFAAVLSAVAGYLKSAKGKGALGEMVVGSILGRLGAEWRILNDLTFVIDGETTQIDHVAISRFGVFVIETKNYSGKIFGKPGEPKWTQVLGRTKSQFQNPLRQNYRHGKFLSETLGVREDFIAPIVVFTNTAAFPKGRPDGVFFTDELLTYMRSFREVRLNNAQTEGVRMKLERLGETTSIKTAQHLDTLSARFCN